MSDESSAPNTPPEGESLPPQVIPVRFPPVRPALLPRPPAPRGSAVGALFRIFISVALAISIGINLLLLLRVGSLGGSGDGHVIEHFKWGNSKAPDKVAVIQIDGVIMEGSVDFARRQIDRAADDDQVKAVVLRINSPGGSITASDDLYKRIEGLRDGKLPRKGKKPRQPKVIVVSMGSLAASGGYYIAMPARKENTTALGIVSGSLTWQGSTWVAAKHIIAEPTTITGSIGVYAAFPNITGLAKEYGFGMDVIKAGEVKDSGSMFHKMTAQERELWQSMVNNAFDRFLNVVAKGRGMSAKMLREPVIRKSIPDREDDGSPKFDADGNAVMVEYSRRRADGGIYTAQEAKKLNLIDDIGYLEDAVNLAGQQAGLKDFKVVGYERPPSLLGSLLYGEQAVKATPPIDASRIANAAQPRLWYLAPQAELAGIIAATESK